MRKWWFVVLQTVMSHYNYHKTGVINDPLGQPTVPAGSDWRLILKFWNGRTHGRTDGQTDTLCQNSDHYRPGLWSAPWINNDNVIMMIIIMTLWIVIRMWYDTNLDFRKVKTHYSIILIS